MKKIIILFLIIFSYSTERINIQLNWKYQFEFAGFIMAKEKGFYKEEGLDVKLLEITKNTSIINNILNNTTTYGIGDSSLISEIMQKKKLELLMPIFDKSPYVLIALNLPKIKSLKDILKYNITLDQLALKNPAILGMLASADKIENYNFKKENYFDVNQKGIFSIYIYIK